MTTHSSAEDHLIQKIQDSAANWYRSQRGLNKISSYIHKKSIGRNLGTFRYFIFTAFRKRANSNSKVQMCINELTFH